MFRVLIVEDDSQLATQLRRALSRHYRVSIASSIKEFDDLLEKRRFDLILLDRLLPDGDTLDMISYIHDCSPSTRILMMSIHSTTDDRITGLTEGADDYLPKPFSVRELELRVSHLLELERTTPDGWTQLGELRFNRLTGETFSGEQVVRLRPREAQILSCLLRFKNRVVTRDTIVNHVWGGSTVPTNTTLDVYLRRLRMMLGKSSAYIETVRGFGYLIREPAVAYK